MFLKNIKRLLLFIVLVIGSSSFQCSEPINEALQEVQLIFPVSISPPQSSINLTDSLQIEATLPDTLQDYISKRYFRLVDFDFKTRIMVRKLTSNQISFIESPPAIDRFGFYNLVGGAYNFLSSTVNVELKYIDNQYLFKFKMIPKDKGVYMVSFLYFPNENRVVKNLINDPNTGQLKDATMSFMVYNINNGNINFDLFKANTKIPSNLGSEPDFNNRFGIFTFEVK